MKDRKKTTMEKERKTEGKKDRKRGMRGESLTLKDTGEDWSFNY